MKPKIRFTLTIMFQSSAKLLSELKKIVLTYVNFSINRSAMYLFVGCTEVALHSCFATFVRLRLSPF